LAHALHCLRLLRIAAALHQRAGRRLSFGATTLLREDASGAAFADRWLFAACLAEKTAFRSFNMTHRFLVFALESLQRYTVAMRAGICVCLPPTATVARLWTRRIRCADLGPFLLFRTNGMRRQYVADNRT